MPVKRPKLSTAVFDLSLTAALLSLLAVGGQYAPMIRRVLVAVAAVGFLFTPFLKKESVFLKAALEIRRVLMKPWGRWSLVLAGFSVSLLLCVLQTFAFRYSLGDMGAYHQILWNLSHGLGYGSTLGLHGGAANSLGLIFLAPFFWLSGGSPLFLPLMGTILIYAGVFAWIYFAERVPGVSQDFRSKLAAGVTVFALFFDNLSVNRHAGYHETDLAFAALSWAFVLLFAEPPSGSKYLRGGYRKAIILALFLVAATAQEILLLGVAIALLCWALQEGRLAFKTRSAQDAWFTFDLVGLAAALMFWFSRTDVTLGLPTSFAGWASLKYLGYLFIPWLFSPLIFWLSRRRLGIALPGLWLLSLLPPLLTRNWAAPGEGGWSIPDFQNALVFWPLLATLSILTLARQRSERLVWAWALLSILFARNDALFQIRTLWPDVLATRVARHELPRLPSGWSMSADERAGTWVAGRHQLSIWPDLSQFPNSCPDLIVVRRSEGGTITELGVQSVILKCEASARPGARVMRKLGQTEAPTPLWRSGEWAAYQVTQDQ